MSWRSAGAVALCAAAFAVAAGAGAAAREAPPAPVSAATFDDRAGDSGAGPDVTRVTVSGYADGQIVLELTVQNRPALEGSESVQVFLDTDRNGATGSAGADFLVTAFGLGRPVRIHKWAGSTWQTQRQSPESSFAAGVLTLRFSRAELAIGDGFEFFVQTYREVPGGVADRAPDSARWTYRLAASGAVTPTARGVTIFASLPSVARPTPYSRADPRYARVASRLAGRKAVVKCWNAADWDALHDERRKYEGGSGLSFVLGFVRTRTNIVNLAPAVCARLDLLAYRGQRPQVFRTKREIANAFATLAHEAMHVAGIEDEAVAECYAMQLTEVVARELGAGWRYGRDLGRILWTHDWPLQKGTAYHTTKCRNGGPLDLYPKLGAWP